MARIDVKDLSNKVVGSLELSDEVFGYEGSETLVWEAVKAFRAGRRKGTHATKNRSATRGGGRKPWRQKGTGRARVGTTRSPLWKGGGIVHGPSPRDYSEKLPKRKRRGAVKVVLTDKLQNKCLTVIEDLALKSHKTKDFAGVLQKLDLGEKVLVVDDRENRNLYLSSRNLPGVKTVSSDGVNIYDLLNCRHLVMSKRAILQLQEVLQR